MSVPENIKGDRKSVLLIAQSCRYCVTYYKEDYLHKRNIPVLLDPLL